MKKLKRTFGNVLFLLKPWWKYGKSLVIWSQFFTIIYPVRIIAEVTIAQGIIEAAQSGRGTAHVVLVAVAYITVIVGLWIAREARIRVFESWIKVDITAAIEREIYEKAIRTDYMYVDSPDFFDNYKMATDEYVSRSQKMWDSVNTLAGGIVGLLSMVGVFLTTEPFVIILVFVGLGIMAVFRFFIASNETEIWRINTPSRRRMNYVTRLLYMKSANADLRATNAKDRIFEHYNASKDSIINVAKRFRWKQFLYGCIYIIGGNLATYIVMLYTALGFVSGRIESIGVFTTLVAATGNMSFQFSQITDNVTSIFETTLYADKVRQFFGLHSEIEPSTGRTTPADAPLSLELRDVSFSYPNSEFGLKNLNITVNAGEKIAIVGENGAGKTTLSKLLLRLYDVNSGEILYNGVNIKDYDVRALRRQIGVAFQEPHLYTLTVRENMQVYHSASDEVLREVLQTVGLDADLDRDVTREFDDSGIMLSGGQAQKLGLSRLLIGEFGLLLLDEPSSALDPLAEYEMTKLMFNRSRTTTIMVAHRLSTIRDADCIYLISNGAVAEQGTHDELIALNGKYAEMFSKQAENYVR
ncbi:MAG: ABC transporter ATP-binding protein/permease [Oscillospiraceae bacterium]|jgi:ATP-binding cassette subfamily B protein|nr:ABC transporter ATP-binding protein/permease [Oscillospiraceae bacterium]